MANFMGQHMEGRYSQEVDALIAWFEKRLPGKGAFSISEAGYKMGVDAVNPPHSFLISEANNEWRTSRKYELSYNQMSQAFFAAAKNLNLITVDRG